MRKVAIFAVSLIVAVPLAAAQIEGMRYAEPTPLPDVHIPYKEFIHTITDKQVGNPHIHPEVVREGSESGFVIPIVGSAAGSGGLFFRSETVIVNRSSAAQNLAIYYFPLGGGAANCNLPGRQLRMDGQTWYVWPDVVADLLGTSGLGALIVIGVTPSGQVDPTAQIDGNSRIWTPQPGSSGTTSQNFPSVSLLMPAGAQSSFGQRSDEFYHSNFGIFNYELAQRTFDVTANGLRGRTTFSTNVDACSAILTGIPGGPYGSYELVVSARDGRANYFSFGSSVDNATGDSWSVIGRSF